MTNKKSYQSNSKISQKKNASKEESTGKISKGEYVNESRKTVEELRFNELLLNSFFDSPGHMRGIVEIVNDTAIRHIKDNLVTANYLKLTPADLEGKLSSELGEPEERIKIWIEHYKISQNTGLPVSWEYVDIEGLNKSWLSPTVSYLGKGNDGNPRFTYDIINITDRKRTEEALQAAEELSRQRLEEIEDLYRNAPVGLCILDSNLRFLRINERLAEINGIPAADHIGKTVRELMPTLADAVEPGMRRILETGEPQLNIEIVSETPALPGFQRTWQEQWLPIKDPYGRITGLSIVVEEITMLRQAEQEVIDAQRLIQSLINNTTAIVYVLDLEERFLLANTSLARLFDSTPEAMIGKRRHEFMPQDDADWHETNDRRVVKEGRPVEFEEYSQLKNRSITWLTTKFPLFDSQGKIYAVAGISNDISERKQAQVKTETLLAEIQIEKERLATLINNIPDEVWIADLNKNFTIMNSIARQEFGLNQDNIGIEEFASSIEVLRPDYSPRPLEEAPALLALKGDIVKNLEEIIRIPASGELRHRQVNASPVKDASGKITGSISIVRDITERKNMEQQLRFHSDILQSVTDAVIVTDTSYNITSWNKPAEKMYGWVEAEVLGRFIREIVQTQTDVEKLNQIYQTVKEGQPIVTEHVQKTKDGSLIIVECNSMPLLDSKGKIIGYVTINRNITERKKAEIKLIERETQLIELNITKDKFFNIVAHDLKNPFTSFLGSSEVLYEKINELNPEDIKKLVLILNDSAKAGYSILLNLLDWSRSQTGMLKISPEKINLKEIVDGNIDNHQLTAYNKGITIINEPEDNLYIISDKNILNTVLRNLLSNAIKYTHRNGKVVVRFKANPDTVTILVTDNGVGISQEKIGTLFKLERAYSLPGTENEIGTGLGLKLCKELIEKLGGIISVESEDGKGTTFFFTIPKNNFTIT